MRIQVYISPAQQADAVSQKLAALLHEALLKADEMEPVDERPDLIHVLGLGDRATTSLISRANRMRIPLVISPSGAYQPWQRSTPSAHLLTSPRQHRNTIAIHVLSQIEQENLTTVMPSAAKNQPSVLIANPVVTATISEEQFCQQMLALYADTVRRHDEAVRQDIDAKTAAQNEPDGAINNILRLTSYASYQHQQGHIARSTLDQLAATLTNSNYDEALFAERLAQVGLTTFFTQIEALMQDHGTLTEGFMPIPAKPAAKNIVVI